MWIGKHNWIRFLRWHTCLCPLRSWSPYQMVDPGKSNAGRKDDCTYVCIRTLSIKFIMVLLCKSHILFSSDGIAAMTQLEDQQILVWYQTRERDFLFSVTSRPDLRYTRSLSSDYWEMFPAGVKRQKREADHSSPACAEIKNSGAASPLAHTNSWRGA
jgi:hypothetical protein